MNAYIVIAFTEVQTQEQNILRIYDDVSEKFFISEELAHSYSQYLNEKGKNTVIAPINVLTSIDLNALRIADALAKLTETDKQLLGL